MSSPLQPRLCVLQNGAKGYGFHLRGEKGKTGQFIRMVDPDSPAKTSGLCAGDRLVFINGENVEGENHKQVVSRIIATAGNLELIVVDQETEELLKKHNLKCLKEFVTEGIPLPSGSAFKSPRELEHQAVQQPNEPKFQIHDDIKSQKEKSSCCKYL